MRSFSQHDNLFLGILINYWSIFPGTIFLGELRSTIRCELVCHQHSRLGSLTEGADVVSLVYSVTRCVSFRCHGDSTMFTTFPEVLVEQTFWLGILAYPSIDRYLAPSLALSNLSSLQQRDLALIHNFPAPCSHVRDVTCVIWVIFPDILAICQPMFINTALWLFPCRHYARVRDNVDVYVLYMALCPVVLQTRGQFIYYGQLCRCHANLLHTMHVIAMNMNVHCVTMTCM